MDREYVLREENEFSALMKLTVPVTIAMLVSAIYNIIDTIFVGKAVGSLGIAALSIYLPVQMIIPAFSLLIGVGTASIISRSFGKKDLNHANKASGNLFLIIGVFSLLLSVFGFAFSDYIMKLFGASSEVLPYAYDYARMMFIGALVFPVCIAANNIIRAEGNAKEAMYTMIIGMVANIFLDYLFIYMLDMGTLGAGLATSISKSLSFIYILHYFFKKSRLTISFKYLKFEPEILKETLSIGSSAFITQISLSLATLLLNHTLYYYGGNQAVSVYGIVYKITLFVLMPLAGLVQGMQPLIGYNLGAKNILRIKKTVKIGLLVSTGVSLFLTALLFISPEFIIMMFTDDSELILMGSTVLRITIIMCPLVAVYMSAIGFYQSIGKGRESLGLSLLRQIFLFIPISLTLPLVGDLGIMGIWLSFPLSDFLAFLIAVLFAAKQYRDKFSPTADISH